MITRIAAIGLAAFVLASCQEEPVRVVPDAVAMTEEALGHYCQMNLSEHEGPKAQIHLEHREHPIWFSQVRDAVAFMRLPEETEQITAVYVNDMGEAPSWAAPGTENWVNAVNAWFVIDSNRRGGMGAPEAVPFADEVAARAFAELHGGNPVRLGEIPDAYVLGPVDLSSQPENSHDAGGHDAGGHDGSAHEASSHDGDDHQGHAHQGHMTQ